jgi:hypothetical protein
MVKVLRYALATFCFAASVGCLALWLHSMTTRDLINVPSYVFPARALNLQSAEGYIAITLLEKEPTAFLATINRLWKPMVVSGSPRGEAFHTAINANGAFGRLPEGVHFPLWYASLIFALAGVASLRLGRRFTLRAAIIATTVVAALLGMAVIL